MTRDAGQPTNLRLGGRVPAGLVGGNGPPLGLGSNVTNHSQGVSPKTERKIKKKGKRIKEVFKEILSSLSPIP